MKNMRLFYSLFMLLLFAIMQYSVYGQKSPEIGKWLSITPNGDSIFYKFTVDGKYILDMVGKRLAPLGDIQDKSLAPASMLTFSYKADYSTTPASIDFYDESGRVISKGIFKITSKGEMKICIDRFGANRPEKFVPSSTKICTKVLPEENKKDLF